MQKMYKIIRQIWCKFTIILKIHQYGDMKLFQVATKKVWILKNLCGIVSLTKEVKIWLNEKRSRYS